MRRSEVHWFVLLDCPLGDLCCFSSVGALCVRRALCLTSKFGPQFTDELHNLWVTLIFWHICRVLSYILEGHHNFWILHVARTSRSLKISFSPGIHGIPGLPLSHSMHSSRRITRNSPGEPPGKESYWLSPGFLPALGSLMFFASLLNLFCSLFDLSLFGIFAHTFSNISKFSGPLGELPSALH